MDVDLNFGRFFGLEIDTFTEAGSSESVPPQGNLNSKKRDFLMGKRYFLQNRLALKWKSKKNTKKTMKKDLQNQCFF